MNRGVLACAIASIVLTTPMSYTIKVGESTQETSIAGKVSPANEAQEVQIVNREDSVTATLVSGNFFARVKPGKYKLLVNTRTNNRVVQLDNVEVKQNQALNVGEIILQ